jgi:hypothetical protein
MLTASGSGVVVRARQNYLGAKQNYMRPRQDYLRPRQDYLRPRQTSCRHLTTSLEEAASSHEFLQTVAKVLHERRRGVVCGMCKMLLHYGTL